MRPTVPLLAEARVYLAQQRQGAGAPNEAHALIAEATRAFAAQQVGPQFQQPVVRNAPREPSRNLIRSVPDEPFGSRSPSL